MVFWYVTYVMETIFKANLNSYEGTSSKEKLMHKHTQAACELEPSNLIVDYAGVRSKTLQMLPITGADEVYV